MEPNTRLALLTLCLVAVSLTLYFGAIAVWSLATYAAPWSAILTFRSSNPQWHPVRFVRERVLGEKRTTGCEGFSNTEFRWSRFM
jgi:hypothetical protein